MGGKWRPKAQREAQNAEILDALAKGEGPKAIAARLGLTRGAVSGVITRAGAWVITAQAVRRRLARTRRARLAKLAAQRSV